MFSPFVSNMIRKTKITEITQHDLEELIPLTIWHSKHCVLLGDAAHAMTPNLGQGAAQSIEDAWVLANSLFQQKSYLDAFKSYQKVRYKKATRITKQSWMIGQITNWKSQWACTLRNELFGLLPTGIANKQKQLLFDVPNFNQQD